MREIMLIVHFIGLVMGLGTAFSHAFLSIAASKMEKEEVTRFRLHVMVLSKMGHIGIALLVISGTFLIIPYWPTLPQNPLLILKLVLVAVLAILLLLIHHGTQKAFQGNADEHLKRIEPYGKLTMLIGLTILVLAVYIFH